MFNQNMCIVDNRLDCPVTQWCSIVIDLDFYPQSTLIKFFNN